jgi:CheY-like chemotaxis protein
MNESVRGLIVDDDPAQLDLIKRALNLEFAELRCRVSWSLSESSLDARSKVLEEEPFDFAIVDFDLGPGAQNGPPVIREIRKRSPETFILVVSSRSKNHPDFVVQSLRAKANHAINRDQMVLDPVPGVAQEDRWDFAALAVRLHRHMLARRRIDDLAIVFDDDLGMKSTLHGLGATAAGPRQESVEQGSRIARSLIIECLDYQSGTGATLHVGHLAPGRSGAYVCKVVRSGEDLVDESFVVKIGLDREALKREQAANHEAGKLLTPDILIQIGGRVVTDASSGYSAFAARLAANAVTLCSWLSKPVKPRGLPTTDQAHAAADVLFAEHLAPLFQRNRREERPLSSWLTLSPVLVLRVRDALSTYQDVWTHEDGANCTDAPVLSKRLLDFLAERKLPTDNPAGADGKVIFVDGFGDLHSSNVLIQHGVHVRPILVDASLYDKHHWAADASRLLVDLVLRVWRSDVESMIWSRFADARAYAQRLCPLASPAVAADGTPIDAFISRVLRRLPEFLRLKGLGLTKQDWHWQWHTALAREFLRQGSRSDLVPPRVVLALTCAAYHLTAAGHLLDHLDYGDSSAPDESAPDCGRLVDGS